MKQAMCLVMALVAVTMFSSAAAAQQRCVPVGGTIAAQFDGDQLAWVGRAYLQFGNGSVLTFALRDDNNGYKDHPYKANFAGNEILTFRLSDTDSFQMAGHFIGVDSSAPYFYGFSETGQIVTGSGTGMFDGMRGNLSIHGSFNLSADALPTTDDPWLWLAQITGSVCGGK